MPLPQKKFHFFPLFLRKPRLIYVAGKNKADLEQMDVPWEKVSKIIFKDGLNVWSFIIIVLDAWYE